jgi:invasion protein IalB
MFVRPARTRGAHRPGIPLVLAVLLSLTGIAAAQQGTDDQAPAPKAKSAKQKSAAPKAEKSDKAEKKSEARPAPARKSNSAPATTSAVPPAPGGGQPTLLGQYGDWGAYTANAGGRTVCYALAKPSSQATQPANRPRDPAYVFISTRPAENVRNEVSVVIGYPFKPGYEASVDIGANKYAMYTQGDGAWVKNPAEEQRMVETMRKGADLVVVGESGKGTKSTDRYTLKGLSQALDRVAAECK